MILELAFFKNKYCFQKDKMTVVNIGPGPFRVISIHLMSVVSVHLAVMSHKYKAEESPHAYG